MTLHLTLHALQRIRQRGFRADDIEIIVELGTMVRRGLHVLRGRDADREIRRCKRRIQTLERLRDSAAVVEDGTVVTCFHTSGAPGRRALRGRRFRHGRTKRGDTR